MTLANPQPTDAGLPPRRAARKARPNRSPREEGGFFKFLFRLTFATHVPVALAWGEALRRLGVGLPWLWGAGLAMVAVLLFRGRVRPIVWDSPRGFWRRVLTEETYFIHWCAALASALVSALALPLTGLFVALGLARGSAFGAVALAVYGTFLALATYAVWVRRHWVVVRRVTLPVRDLPEAFEGVRIAHLSDLHIGGFMPRATGERWVRMANREKPDLVAVTGDLVTSGTAFHHDIAEVLGGLEAPLGVFASMGNHDYFGDGEPLITLLRGKGLQVLRNASATVERGGARLRVAGVDDTWTKRADLDQALARPEPGVPTVLLAHDPDLFPEAAARGADVVLSGHTHAGQVAVPFLTRRFNLSRLRHPFSYGVYRKGDSSLYVHAGLGITGPPVRLGAAPEVVILTLRRAR
ncbi:MAG TPA: metallophosphoesterase [Polyangiaceae bacterium]|nr:metallophosphoesterase [Polyangiaceae bacterium]